jgi:hypothetical protein
MAGLRKYVNSSYFSAANKLNGKNKSRKITAYVESYDDVFFWRSILSRLETPTLKFQVMLPTRGKKLERGKKAALMAAFNDRVGPNMIACVDADYDYLRQGSNSMSEMVCNNKYVFHTYAYAIENLQCWAPALREVCVMVTLNDYPDMLDFEHFMETYSEIIYPLFVWNILSARKPEMFDFSIPEMLTVIKTGVVVKNHMQETLRRVSSKVEKKINRLFKTTSENVHKEYERLSKELQTLGIKSSETYLYIQGHQLFNETVVPMLSRECDFLIAQREKEIRSQSKHYTQYDNEISCYENSLEEVSSMLKKNILYLNSPQVQHIIDNLKRFIKEIEHE